MVYWTSALALVAFMTAAWALSLRLRDASVVDIAWGLNFVIVAWIALAGTEGDSDRSLLLALMTTVWGARLAGYILWRKLREGGGEDRRYTVMRERHPNFAIRSLATVFLTQALLAWIVALPLTGAAGEGGNDLGVLDLAGVVLWAAGLGFEAIGDAQLAGFKRDPANKGRVMDRGLWRYTRHPNYFGDFCVWWGIYLLALSGGAWWTAIGPAVMSVLLIRVSGKGLTEKLMADRPGFAEYVAATSGFIPLPPKRPR